MYLAPNVFSNTAYHLVTFVILLLLCGGIFYLLCPLFRRFLPGTCGEWITVSSILSFLCIQTVEFQCDSFYWYNGSMYYTGFFAVTLFFLGTLFRYLDNGKRILLLPLLLFAVFLGGGNYVSLLPCMLLSVTITLLLLLQKNKKAYICGITSVVLLLSFAVSAIAPGNHVRQSGMWKIPAWKAIAKCLDGIVVGACRAASAAGLPADPAEEKRSIFLPPYSVYRLCLRTVLLHVLSPVLYHELHGTGPGGCHRLLYVPTDQFYRILLLDRLCAAENAGTTETPERIEVSGKLNTARYLAMAVLLFSILCTGLWQETSAMKAIRVLTDGEAAAYAAEYEDRLLLLNDPEVTDVILTPFTHQPTLIYTGDLPGDPEDPTSRKVAQYFQKTSLYVNYGSN